MSLGGLGALLLGRLARVDGAKFRAAPIDEAGADGGQEAQEDKDPR